MDTFFDTYQKISDTYRYLICVEHRYFAIFEISALCDEMARHSSLKYIWCRIYKILFATLFFFWLQILLATTSTDGKCRVFSTFIKGVDAKYDNNNSECGWLFLFIFKIVKLLIFACRIGTGIQKRVHLIWNLERFNFNSYPHVICWFCFYACLHTF